MKVGITSLFVRILFVSSLEWIVLLMCPSLASWPQTVAAALVTIATALILTKVGMIQKSIIILPLCGLGMTAERRRVKGSVKEGLDLSSGLATGENRLLNLTRCPADQIPQRGGREVDLGGGSWSHRIVSILIAIFLGKDLVHSESPVLRI